jgi:hypothetical protein
MDALERLIVAEAVRQTKARYSFAMDQKMWDAFGDVFTIDAVMTMGSVENRGRDAIVRFVQGELATVQTSHISHSPIIDVHSADAAHATWSTMYVQENDRLTGWGFYDEDYSLERDGIWRIKRTYLRTTFFKGAGVADYAIVED